MRFSRCVASFVALLALVLSFGMSRAEDGMIDFCYQGAVVQFSQADAFRLEILGLKQSDNTVIIINHDYSYPPCSDPTSTTAPASTATDMVPSPADTSTVPAPTATDVPMATSTTASNDGGKVFVCKYVGTPGVDERLQTGQNPISVSVNAIPNYQGVGSYFADAQGRSYVLSVDARTGGGQEGEPGVDQCPPPDTGEIQTNTPAPTNTPVDTATTAPTEAPTMEPTDQPTSSPTTEPTMSSTVVATKTPIVVTDPCEAFSACTATPVEATQTPTEKPTTPPEDQDGGTATTVPDSTVIPVDDSDGGDSSSGTTELPNTGSGYILPHKDNTEKMMIDVIFYAGLALLAMAGGFMFLRRQRH